MPSSSAASGFSSRRASVPTGPATSCSGFARRASRTAPSPIAALPRLDITVGVVEDLGSDTHVIFPIDAPRVDTEDVRRAADDDETTLTDTAVFNARVDARTAARPGEPLQLAVDPDGLYWFDATTGASLKRRATGAATELAALS